MVGPGVCLYPLSCSPIPAAVITNYIQYNTCFAIIIFALRGWLFDDEARRCSRLYRPALLYSRHLLPALRAPSQRPCVYIFPSLLSIHVAHDDCVTSRRVSEIQDGSTATSDIEQRHPISSEENCPCQLIMFTKRHHTLPP